MQFPRSTRLLLLVALSGSCKVCEIQRFGPDVLPETVWMRWPGDGSVFLDPDGRTVVPEAAFYMMPYSWGAPRLGDHVLVTIPAGSRLTSRSGDPGGGFYRVVTADTEAGIGGDGVTQIRLSFDSSVKWVQGLPLAVGVDRMPTSIDGEKGKP